MVKRLRSIQHNKKLGLLRADVSESMDNGRVKMQALTRAKDVLVLSYHHLNLPLQDKLKFLTLVLLIDRFVFGLRIDEDLKGLEVFVPRLRSKGLITIGLGSLLIIIGRLLACTLLLFPQEDA